VIAGAYLARAVVTYGRPSLTVQAAFAYEEQC